MTAPFVFIDRTAEEGTEENPLPTVLQALSVVMSLRPNESTSATINFNPACLFELEKPGVAVSFLTTFVQVCGRENPQTMSDILASVHARLDQVHDLPDPESIYGLRPPGSQFDPGTSD